MMWRLRGIKEANLNINFKKWLDVTIFFKNGSFWPKTPKNDPQIIMIFNNLTSGQSGFRMGLHKAIIQISYSPILWSIFAPHGNEMIPILLWQFTSIF